MPTDHTPNALATLVTMTTYGAWLRGDRRGWIEKGGRLRRPAQELEQADRKRQAYDAFRFGFEDFYRVGAAIGRSLAERLGVHLYAITVDSWHVHFVAGATQQPIARIVKCAKDAVRYELRAGRPIWTTGYDKRWCFEEEAVLARIRYVERHNERAGLGSRPWGFVRDPFSGAGGNRDDKPC